MGVLYLLFESASGFGLFERVKSEEIGVELPEVQKAVVDLQRFSKIMKLHAFQPFTSAENALENIMAVSEGEVTKSCLDWLELQLPKTKKDGKPNKFKLGVTDPKIGNMLQEMLSIKCVSDELVLELMRGIRLHFDRFIKALKPGDIHQAQLGLSHGYSRSKVKFNVHRVDNMIIQSIALLDQLDKDLNTFSMRVREWFSWHFPELIKIVPDNHMFCKLVLFIQNRALLTEESLGGIEEIVGSAETAKAVLEASRMSMGTDIAEIDMQNIHTFAARVSALGDYRKRLHEYLCSKMHLCAPNLTQLIGEMVGARLISHAGSLTSLAKYPASTVQILGAEKALFRALKTKGNTPKYGLIFHSTFIGRAATKNKGRISRYVANKCSLASRIDAFAETPVSPAYGIRLRQQVEERLEFYKTGAAPRKNIDVMREAGVEAMKDAQIAAMDVDQENGKKKKKKSKKQAQQPEEIQEVEPTPKKEKKKRKVVDEPEETPTKRAKPVAVEAEKSEKKKKKKSKAAE